MKPSQLQALCVSILCAQSGFAEGLYGGLRLECPSIREIELAESVYQEILRRAIKQNLPTLKEDQP